MLKKLGRSAALPTYVVTVTVALMFLGLHVSPTGYLEVVTKESTFKARGAPVETIYGEIGSVVRDAAIRPTGPTRLAEKGQLCPFRR